MNFRTVARTFSGNRFDGKNKNKSKTEDGKGQNYSWPLQIEAAGLTRNGSHESIKKLEAQSRAGISAGMKTYLDLQTALAAAELVLQHPHLDVIESAMKKFENLRVGGSPNKQIERCTGYTRIGQGS